MWTRLWQRAALTGACVSGFAFTGCKVADPGDYTFGQGATAATSGGGSSGALSGGGGVSGSAGIGGGEPNPQGMCPDGEHWCIDSCVRNDDVRTCGTSCSPCDVPTDGVATCDGIRCGAACTGGQKLCLGACIDGTEACEGTCPEGTHACGDRCVSDQSVNACGTSCDPCPVPAGAAQATCDGAECDFQCLTGYHRCGDACVADDDIRACGAECTQCPVAENGAAECVDGTCIVQCDAGFHLCDGVCVADTSPLTCGSSCEPCPTPTGGTATCTAGACGARCPSGEEVCLGACVPAGTACEGGCGAGLHACNDFCVSDTSTNSCGTACTPCPVPAGASQATCDGTACGFTCGTGYHRCGNRCAANNDATACGASCTDCPDDPNGTSICQNGSCALQCKSGYHLCGNRCVNNRDVATCGPTSCTACTAPMGGTVTCDGLACQPACPANMKRCNNACVSLATACNGMCDPGSHACSGLCVANTNVNSCGTTSCSACAVPQNGRATCDGSSCGIACNTGFHLCGSSCLSNTSVASCGTSCTACPAPPANATATCNGTRCGFSCNAGYTGANCEFPRLLRVPRISGVSSASIAGLSTDGTAVIGNMQRTAMTPTAYHWVIGTAGVTYIVPLAGQTDSAVGAISGDGLRVYGLSGTRPFSWRTTEELNAFPPRNGENLSFYDASADGGIAVGDQPGVSGRAAFVLDNSISNTTSVGAGFDSSTLYGITADGLTAVGFVTTAGATSAAVWTSAAGLRALAPVGGSAADISDDSRFIVGTVNNRASRWSGATYGTVTALPLPSGITATYARDVNADGSVIVGWGNATGVSATALVWTGGTVQRIQDALAAAGVSLTGWSLRSADYVSGDGSVIAGQATAPDGQSTGFIARWR